MPGVGPVAIYGRYEHTSRTNRYQSERVFLLLLPRVTPEDTKVHAYSVIPASCLAADEL